MRPNELKERWRQGKSSTNCWLMLGHGFAAEMIAHQGWDSLTIDMQHGLADHGQMVAMLTAISTFSVPLVRVPWNEPGAVMRALDVGAYGVICPNIETKEECERFVGACRYPPQGYRSVGPLRTALIFGPNYMSRANENVLAIVQVETAKGLANVREIAAVKGLDMLYVGPSDLGISLGREARADQTDPVVVEAIDEILAAAKAAGLHAGIYCSSADYAQAMLDKGFDFVTVTSDAAMIGSGAAVAKRFMR